MSLEKYCTAAVTNVEPVFKKSGLRLLMKCVTLLSCGYRPDMDVTVEIKEDGVQWYQELIGGLRREVEIGRIYILL